MSGPHSLVETDTDRVLGVDSSIKRSLKVTMCTKCLLDITTSSTLGPQRQGLEPFHVLAVEEHVSDGDELLVDMEGMASENDSLGDDSGR